jgi:hypothetical protein
MKTFKQFLEEDGAAAGIGGTPTNSVGGGAIAGCGVGPQGEPGVSKKKKSNPVIATFTRKSNG